MRKSKDFKVNFQSDKIAREILVLASGLGVLTGLIEGFLLFTLHRSGWLNWRLYNRAIWYETLWISPLMDFALFFIIGLGLLGVKKAIPKYDIKKIAWYVYVYLAVFDWIFIATYGRISIIAIFFLALGMTTQIAYFIIRLDAKTPGFMSRLLPWLVGISVAIFAVIQGGGWLRERQATSALPSAHTGAPNIIVIVVDTLRADHLSSYGYERNTSPFIDSLAQQGIIFKNAISASSWTLPSHASMLTGRYTFEHQAELKPLDQTFPTIGEIMQSNGYRTGAFSANTEFFTRRQGFGRGFLHFEDNYQSVEDFGLNTLYGFILDRYLLRGVLGYEEIPGRRLAADINQSVLDWLSKNDDHPYFVFINYFDVHDPYTPPEPYRSKYSSVSGPGGLINAYVERLHPDLTPDQLQSEIDAYDGSISYTDDQIKALFNELELRGMLDNTIVILTSDHGESLGEHGLLQHSASLYLQEIHVPLIIWGEGIPANKQIEIPVSTTSLPSTILSLVKVQNDAFPEPSLAVLILGETVPANWPKPISEVAQFIGSAEQNPTTHGEMKSVVGDKLQYIVHEKFGDELYNWHEDPQETSNLVKDPAQAPVLDTFKKYIKELIGEPIFKQP